MRIWTDPFHTGLVPPPKRRLTNDDMVLVLTEACRVAGSQRAWARKNKVSYKWVNRVLRGDFRVSMSLALALGYRRVVEYERMDNEGEKASRDVFRGQEGTTGVGR